MPRSGCDQSTATDPDLLPHCHHEFETTYRPSWNIDLDPISDEELAELTTATCPVCSTVLALDTLVVEGDVWTVGARAP